MKEIVIRPKSPFFFNFGEIWRYRELVFFFCWRDFKVRYKQALLGVAWTVLQPLVLMLVFTNVFVKGLGMSTDDIPAPLFFYVGIMLWTLFNQTVTTASHSIINNADLIKKIYFPKLIIAISAVVLSSFDFVINLLLFVFLCFYYLPLDVMFTVLPTLFLSIIIAYLIVAVVSFSIGSLLAAWNVKYRDVRYALPFVIQVIFFITPVMYDLASIKISWLEKIAIYNPLAYAITLVRNSLQGLFTLSGIFIPLLVLVLCYICGTFTFKRMEQHFADMS